MKKLLIIGAGFLQAFVIRRAKELGYYTLCVDGNPNAVGFAYADEHAVVNIVDKEACLAYAREKRVDGVLTAATDYGVLSAAFVAEEMGLKGIPYEVARLIKNKYRVRRRLYEHHVDDTAEAYEVDAETDLRALCADIRFPVMVKPCDGSGSRGASRVDKKEDLAAACALAINSSVTRRAEIETFIVGKEYGAETLVTNGKVHVLSVMRKWMTEPPYYAELGHAIPTDLPAEVEARAKQCVENAVHALGITFGSVNMDMLITPEGKIHIIDVGARMGGNMIGPCVIPYGTGIDYVAAMIRNAASDDVELVPSAHGAVATRLIAFEKEGTVACLPDREAFEEAYGVELYHHISVGEKINPYRTNLDGCGYIVAKRETVSEAIKAAVVALDAFKASVL